MSKSSKPSISIQAHFEDLTDPRTRKVRYPLINVVVIAICAVSAVRMICRYCNLWTEEEGMVREVSGSERWHTFA